MLQMGLEFLIIRTLKKCLRAAVWLTILIVPLSANLASAQSVKPRPFYIIAHRVNSPALVEEALRQGANAIEIDLRCDASGAWIVSHDAGEADEPSLSVFLFALQKTAARNSRLSLVVLDVKSLCREEKSSIRLIEMLEKSLPPKINVLVTAADAATAISLALGGSATFRTGSRRAIATYFEDDHRKVAVTFRNAAITHFGFGYGVFAGCPCPLRHSNIVNSVTEALARRAEQGHRFIYVWTLDHEPALRRYVALGVDGIVVDLHWVPTIRKIIAEQHPRLRLATRSDPAFGAAVARSQSR